MSDPRPIGVFDSGVGGLTVGDAYLVYGPTGCGRCAACSRGQDTYCARPDQVGHAGMGLGRDGGMAEYLLAPARNLVPLGDADPVAAAATRKRLLNEIASRLG